MRQFIVRRLIQSALLLWILMSFTFTLTRLAPGGPETALLEQPNYDRASIERLREKFGLNDPIPIAYLKWMASAIRLDFGRSYHYLRPPMDVIAERLGPTIQLALVAYAISVIGIPLGVLAAMNRGRLPDLFIRVFTILGDSVPHWWLGLVIIVVLASTIGWFPSGQGREGPLDWLRHIIIPGTLLGLGGIVAFTRYVRSQVLEVISQDYVRTARAKGLAEQMVARRHVLRNALMPVVTLLGGVLPSLVAGAAITEGIFNWPGMGRLYLEAASTRDYPLLLAIVSLTTVLTLLGTLIADVLYGYVDPRVRYGQ
jgi:peptide/nickel transport system permease protein